jgi:hypothetical protein
MQNISFSCQQRPRQAGTILRWLGILLLLVIGFWFVDKVGLPPLSAAILLIFFRGLLRILFKVICFIVSTAILIFLLSLIF